MNIKIDRQKLNAICEENDISYLGVFGSHARGEEVGGSDVDLLVSFGEAKSLLDHVRVENVLADLFEKKVDLVTRKSLHPYIRDYVLADLKPIYE